LWKKGQSGNPKGRPKGARNKLGLAYMLRSMSRKMHRGGAGSRSLFDQLTPLQFMLEVLRNPDKYPFIARQWAAKEAAPYMHRKMPIAIEGGDTPVGVLDYTKLLQMPQGELARTLANIERVLAAVGGVPDAMDDL